MSLGVRNLAQLVIASLQLMACKPIEQPASSLAVFDAPSEFAALKQACQGKKRVKRIHSFRSGATGMFLVVQDDVCKRRGLSLDESSGRDDLTVILATFAGTDDRITLPADLMQRAAEARNVRYVRVPDGTYGSELKDFVSQHGGGNTIVYLSGHGETVGGDGATGGRHYTVLPGSRIDTGRTSSYGDPVIDTESDVIAPLAEGLQLGQGGSRHLCVFVDECQAGSLVQQADQASFAGGHGGKSGDVTIVSGARYSSQDVMMDPRTGMAGPTGAILLNYMIDPSLNGKLASAYDDRDANGESVPFATGNDLEAYFSSGFAPQLTTTSEIDGRVQLLSGDPERDLRHFERFNQKPAVGGNHDAPLFGPVDFSGVGSDELRSDLGVPASVSNIGYERQQWDAYQTQQETAAPPPGDNSDTKPLAPAEL